VDVVYVQHLDPDDEYDWETTWIVQGKVADRMAPWSHGERCPECGLVVLWELRRGRHTRGPHPLLGALPFAAGAW
jgi:hypothetical protein